MRSVKTLIARALAPAFLSLLLVACGSTAPAPATPAPTAQHRATTTTGAPTPDDELDAVSRVHGAPGPWAVLGYRMGKRALVDLALPAGSFDLDVTHFTPQKVQYSCIADGAQAATHVSAGKLNLHIKDATVEQVQTTYLNKRSGASVTYAPSAAFRRAYTNAPRERARELGREVLLKPDAELFERVRIE